MPLDYRRLTPWLGLTLLLLTAWLSYRPGLAGGFLFDDFVNLPALGSTGVVDDLPTFWRYITSGTADPTGRPLALLSFLLDAQDWPASPAPFLRTNLTLHLINGGLLYFLLRSLGRRLDGTSVTTDSAALLGAGLWLLHPLFVSTTLYIVQREAILPATFVLFGLLLWLHGYGLLEKSLRAGTLWMVAGIVVGTLLAVLCKANGLLLPLLAWVLDATVLRKTWHQLAPPVAARTRLLRWLLLIVPSLLLFAYLLSYVPGLGDDLASRPWTRGQRLLTESRILLDYLHLLVVPRVLSTGLYNDAYPYSTGLLQPMSTVFAMAAMAAVLAAGLSLRKRTPAFAAGILFFLGGHLLESTVIELELYFEHRNYLPSMLLFWPLARSICRWQTSRQLRAGIALGLLVLLAAITWQRATLWSQQERMALLWAAQNPTSSRAQATAASFESKTQYPERAMQRLAMGIRGRPHDLQLALNYANAACARHGLTPQDVNIVEAALRHAATDDQLVYRWLGQALATAISGQCSGLDLATVDSWLAAAHANPKMIEMPGRQQDLYSLLGQLELARHNPDGALSAFNHALEAWITPQAAAKQTAILASNEYYAHALAHLDRYALLESRGKRDESLSMRRLHQWVLDRQGFWPHELTVLRTEVRAELAAAASETQPTSSKSETH